MGLLKRGHSGPAITELQKMLRELDYDLPVSGIFDTATYNAVRNFQSRHLDKHNMPLEVDGKVGDLSFWALTHPRGKVLTGAIDFSKMPANAAGGSLTGRAALKVAIDELNAGAGEEGGNNMGRWVRKYLQPAGLPEGNSWCAGFVSWCFLQAVGGEMRSMPFIYSAGARNIFNQLKQKGFVYDASAEQPFAGDIVTWWRVSTTSGFGHIGIVHHFSDGFLYTIEGNKAANVAGFSYVKSRMSKLLGYARVP